LRRDLLPQLETDFGDTHGQHCGGSSRPRAGSPAAQRSPEIGRGESTIVLEADVVDGQERVYKVLSSPTDYAYYTAPDRPTGRHFPVVFADHGTAGRSSRGFPFISSRSKSSIRCPAPAKPPKWRPSYPPPISTPA
jgi:hypothetical protein